MLKLATVGTSTICENFINAMKLTNRYEYTCVYSREMEKGKEFAQKYGAIFVFDDLEKMATSDKFDAVYIASPNFLHYSQSKLFLENGKHVLCEKPITITSDEHNELCALAKKNNLIYMEAIMLMHLPALKVLKDAIKQIGEVKLARFDFSQLSSKYQNLLNGDVPNIFNPKMGTGCLMDLGIYCVYPAIALFGLPKNINSNAVFLPTGADGLGNSIFTYDDMQVNLSYSKVCQGYIGSEIIGTNGCVKIGSISRLANIILILNENANNPGAGVKSGCEDLIYGELTKYELMSYEAISFYNYIKKPHEFSEEYFSMNKYANDVCKTLEKIRQQCAIKFDI